MTAQMFSAAQKYRGLGLDAFPLVQGDKHPLKGYKWADVSLTDDDAVAKFFKDTENNIAAKTGRPSQGFIRYDPDTLLARRAAAIVCRDAGWIMGRKAEATGYCYRVDDPGLKTEVLRHPILKDEKNSQHGKPIIELLANGRYTVVPPSVHPDGSVYEWRKFEDLTTIPGSVAVQRVYDIGALALVSEQWDNGRHFLSLNLPGWMLKGGKSVEWVEEFLGRVLEITRDDEPADRLRALADTVLRWKMDPSSVAGYTELANGIDERVLRRLQRWLGLGGNFAHEMTDLGNARQMIDLYGEDLRYCTPQRKWYGWDTSRWLEDQTEAIMNRAKAASEHLLGLAITAPEHAWALKSQSLPRLEAMVKLGRSEPDIPITPDELDADPWVLGVPGGIVDLRTGKALPPDRSRLITKQAGFAYDPTATCPTWEDHLALIMADDEEMMAYLRRAFGYSLIGDIRGRTWFVCDGETARNGKSTTLDVIAHVLGDYAHTLPDGALLAKQSDEHPTWIAALKGVRFAKTVETDEGRSLNLALIKRLTGDETIRGRFTHRDGFEFHQSHKLWLATNYRPLARNDRGFFDRTHVIPFTVRIEEGSDRDDPNIKEKLKAEGEGILAWMVRGCLEWQRDGLRPPKRITEATREWRDASDLLGRFFEEKAKPGDKAKTPMTDVAEAYNAWCKRQNEFGLSSRALSDRLRNSGYQVKRGNGNVLTLYGYEIEAERFP